MNFSNREKVEELAFGVKQIVDKGTYCGIDHATIIDVFAEDPRAWGHFEKILIACGLEMTMGWVSNEGGVMVYKRKN